MSVFNLYAAYYDLLYRDKDYSAETSYVLSLISEVKSACGSVLELGCGTGGHAVHLARSGFDVSGIDLSADMVERARRRRELETSSCREKLAFECADIRTFRAQRTFDAVVSLFHVMSYQTTNADQDAAFATARSHLAPGGVFVFDFWYGPAVLTDRPKHVRKEMHDERISVRRETAPTMYINENCVDVRFDVQIASRSSDSTEKISENHRMRYLFLPEIEQRLQQARFELVCTYAWMSRLPLSDQSWYGCVSARAIAP